jgi:immune inhibitor A
VGVASQNKRTIVILAVVAAALVALIACLCLVGAGALGGLLLFERGTGPAEPTPSGSDFQLSTSSDGDAALAGSLAQRLSDTDTSDTDYWVLYGQLRSKTGQPVPRQPVRGPTEYQVGDVHTFWLSDEERHQYWQIDAQLEIKTLHSYFYVDQSTSLDLEDLQAAADLFEDQILPTNRRLFGLEWTPGIDNDPHLTILVTQQMPLGIAGYFSSTDEYPKAMNERSNEREMIYVTSSYLVDLDLFGQLLSHEYQHMIHWNQDRSEALWINEGLSLLAEEINGYPSVLGGQQFWRDPDVQLTNWAEDPDDRYANYAASKLFLSYLGEHYGGYEIMASLTADEAYGAAGVEDLLRERGAGVGFSEVFADWTVANLINDRSVGDGRYGYALRESGVPQVRAKLGSKGDYAGWVSQYGADYIEIDAPSGTRVTFQGSTRVDLTGADPYQGDFAWWANRRNMLSSSLTREVDLTSVERATLQFWTWYDIEEHFDYGYVAISTDGGLTWTTLPGTHTTSDDPNQANYGYGYTGKSGEWSKEQVDLGDYAGGKVLLRFWYISDPGLNQPGWMIDNISIPEVGFADDVERKGEGWIVDGFVRSSNAVPQSYLVQWVESGRTETGSQITVQRLVLDEQNQVAVRLDEGVNRATLVVSGNTPWTSEPAPYRVQVE